MDEMAQGLEQGVSSGTSDLTTSAPQEAKPKSDERLFRQTELNEIVGRAKHDAVESYKRRQEQQYQTQSQASTQQNINSIDQDSFRKLAAEEAQRLRDEWVNEARQKAENEYAEKVVQTFWDKVNSGKTKYEDFDTVTANMNYGSFPNVVHLLAEAVDNSGDVLYELGKNRLGLVQLEQLSQISPQDAIEHVKRLSQSIKDNEAASKAKVANQPLSQLRPSSYGTDAGAPLSVSDFRRKWKV